MPDAEKLKSLYLSGRPATAIFDYLASKRRATSVMTAGELEEAMKGEGVRIARPRTMAFFRALAQAGCGRFLVGRRGRATRLEWTCSPSDAARSARGDVEQAPAHFAAARDGETETGTRKRGKPAGPRNDVLLRHRHHLRPAIEVLIDLPSDLTDSEARRLADFIRNLPFPDQRPLRVTLPTCSVFQGKPARSRPNPA